LVTKLTIIGFLKSHRARYSRVGSNQTLTAVTLTN